MPLLSFPQAVERVRTEKGAAFAFCPIADARNSDRNRGCVGANLFVLAHCVDSERQQNPEYCVHYVGGLYRSSSLVRERYRSDQVPLDAREAHYRFLRRFDETMLDGELQTIRNELRLQAEEL
jgi:hypothetical protein